MDVNTLYDGKPKWFDDPDEVVAFVTWYYEGTTKALVSEVVAMFEKPWKWDNEYRVDYLEYLKGQK